MADQCFMTSDLNTDDSFIFSGFEILIQNIVRENNIKKSLIQRKKLQASEMLKDIARKEEQIKALMEHTSLNNDKFNRLQLSISLRQSNVERLQQHSSLLEEHENSLKRQLTIKKLEAKQRKEKLEALSRRAEITLSEQFKQYSTIGQTRKLRQQSRLQLQSPADKLILALSSPTEQSNSKVFVESLPLEQDNREIKNGTELRDIGREDSNKTEMRSTAREDSNRTEVRSIGREDSNRTEIRSTGREDSNRTEIRSTGREDSNRTEMRSTGRENRNRAEMRSTGREDSNRTEMRSTGREDRNRAEMRNTGREDRGSTPVKSTGREGSRSKEVRTDKENSSRTDGWSAGREDRGSPQVKSVVQTNSSCTELRNQDREDSCNTEVVIKATEHKSNNARNYPGEIRAQCNSKISETLNVEVTTDETLETSYMDTTFSLPPAPSRPAVVSNPPRGILAQSIRSKHPTDDVPSNFTPQQAKKEELFEANEHIDIDIGTQGTVHSNQFNDSAESSSQGKQCQMLFGEDSEHDKNSEDGQCSFFHNNSEDQNTDAFNGANSGFAESPPQDEQFEMLFGGNDGQDKNSEDGRCSFFGNNSQDQNTDAFDGANSGFGFFGFGGTNEEDEGDGNMLGGLFGSSNADDVNESGAFLF